MCVLDAKINTSGFLLNVQKKLYVNATPYFNNASKKKHFYYKKYYNISMEKTIYGGKQQLFRPEHTVETMLITTTNV